MITVWAILLTVIGQMLITYNLSGRRRAEMRWWDWIGCLVLGYAGILWIYLAWALVWRIFHLLWVYMP